MTIKEKIYKIIKDKLDLSTEELNDDASLESLGADSLDTIDIILECEREFSIIISEETAHGLLTVGDFVRHIESETNGHYHKYDKPTNHRIARKPVRIVHEERNENWYQ